MQMVSVKIEPRRGPPNCQYVNTKVDPSDPITKPRYLGHIIDQRQLVRCFGHRYERIDQRRNPALQRITQ